MLTTDIISSAHDRLVTAYYEPGENGRIALRNPKGKATRAKRSCIACRKVFMSENFGHRRCANCETKRKAPSKAGEGRYVKKEASL